MSLGKWFILLWLCALRSSEVTGKADRAQWHQLCASRELTCVILATISWTDCPVSLVLNDEGDKLRRNYRCQIGSSDHFHYSTVWFSDGVLTLLCRMLYTLVRKDWAVLWAVRLGWRTVPCLILLPQMAWLYRLLSLLCMEHGAAITGKGNPWYSDRNLPRAALLATNSIWMEVELNSGFRSNYS